MKRKLLKNTLSSFGFLLAVSLGVSVTACQKRASTEPQAYLGEPKVGDVYVVRFKPVGDTVSRYYFYKLYRVTPDSALFHPARKESEKADADVKGADFFADTQTLAYTRKELPDLLKEQPGDVLKTRLVGIRRE
jgi:hypothetical protein